jgi:hypothetical protein
MQPSTPRPARPRSEAGRQDRGARAGFAFCGAALMLAAVTPVWSMSPAISLHTAFGDGSFAIGLNAQSWAGFTDWLSASYQQAPALVLGLVVLASMPFLALIGLWAMRREAATTDISQAKTQVRRVARPKAAEPREGVRTGHIPLRPQEAWIEIVNRGEVAPKAPEKKYSLARTLLRIGREQDNDICLEDKTVHRYHAAIHRTEDAEFVVTDLSSAGGNGVVVNGRSVAEARLSNGDEIQLGKARLRFMAGPAGS